MSQTEQKIDVAGVARQALAERQAGEDLDELFCEAARNYTARRAL